MSHPRVPIGMLFKVVNGATPKSGEEDLWDGDIPWITPADLGKSSTANIAKGARSITREGLQSCGTQIVPVGSIVISTRAPIGHTSIAAEPLCFNQGCRGLIPIKTVFSKFGYWAILSENPTLQSEGQGTTFQELSRDKLKAIRIPLPDLPTQRRIADFLDRETARIDLLIEKKQRLVAVLSEKLSAFISNAVRGYFTSSGATRCSDIEWFDSYPEYWIRMPLKALGNGPGAIFIDGNWIESKDLSGSGVRYLTTGNVGQGVYKEQDARFISNETFSRLKCTEVFPGDILISRLNPPIGRACIVPDLGARIVTSVDNVIVRPGDHIDRQFIVHLLTSVEHFENTSNIARGTTMQRISRSALGKIRIPLPPLVEQGEIARKLNAQAQAHLLISDSIKRSIDRLREYRSALITAAVTGQIDVDSHTRSGATDRRLDTTEEELGA